MMQKGMARFSSATLKGGQLIQRPGIPATTTATAAEEAMRFMGFRKIVLAGPYIKEINEKFREFYNASGFEVLNVVGLDIEDLFEIGATNRRRLQSRDGRRRPEADGSSSPAPISVARTSSRRSSVTRASRWSPPIRPRPGT